MVERKYRRIFDVVRLIEEETIQMMEEGREEEVDPEKVACYSFWKKNRQPIFRRKNF